MILVNNVCTYSIKKSILSRDYASQHSQRTIKSTIVVTIMTSPLKQNAFIEVCKMLRNWTDMLIRGIYAWPVFRDGITIFT